MIAEWIQQKFEMERALPREIFHSKNWEVPYVNIQMCENSIKIVN